jgi:hypothetical protein
MASQANARRCQLAAIPDARQPSYPAAGRNSDSPVSDDASPISPAAYAISMSSAAVGSSSVAARASRRRSRTPKPPPRNVVAGSAASASSSPSVDRTASIAWAAPDRLTAATSRAGASISGGLGCSAPSGPLSRRSSSATSRGSSTASSATATSR